MSVQIAIRLPDDMVEFVDGQVGSGAAKSRAEFIARAIRREQRRLVAERDAAIYAAGEPDEDMAALIAHTSRRSLDQLD